MFDCKKIVGVSFKVLVFNLNAVGTSCQITVYFHNTLYIDSHIATSSVEDPLAISFGCARSFVGTHFEDINLSLTLHKTDSGKTLSSKDMDAIYGNSVVICTTTCQLTKSLNITAVAMYSYRGPNAMTSVWYPD